MAQYESSPCGHEAFDNDHQQYGCYNQQDVVVNKTQVEHHTDGNKKEAGKSILKRKYVTKSILAVFRARNHQPTQESPKSQRHAHLGSQQGHGKANEQNAHQEQFLVFGQGDHVQHFGHHPFVASIHHSDNCHWFDGQDKHLTSYVFGLAPQHWGEQNQRDQNDILKYKDAHHRSSIIGGQFTPFLKNFKYQGRTAQGSQKPNK